MPKSGLVFPRIAVDRGDRTSLRQQIYAQVAGAIRRGEVADGARLPSSRLLAKMLGVSRNTVVEAYERLLEDGLVAMRRGSGVRVCGASVGRVPSFQHLRRTMRAAHYPERTVQFEDPDGAVLYLNATR